MSIPEPIPSRLLNGVYCFPSTHAKEADCITIDDLRQHQSCFPTGDHGMQILCEGPSHMSKPSPGHGFVGVGRGVLLPIRRLSDVSESDSEDAGTPGGVLTPLFTAPLDIARVPPRLDVGRPRVAATRRASLPSQGRLVPLELAMASERRASEPLAGDCSPTAPNFGRRKSVLEPLQLPTDTLYIEPAEKLNAFPEKCSSLAYAKHERRRSHAVPTTPDHNNGSLSELMSSRCQRPGVALPPLPGARSRRGSINPGFLNSPHPRRTSSPPQRFF